MRLHPAWAWTGLALICGAAWVYSPAASQDTPDAGSDVSAQPESSLDLGPAFDRQAQQEFLQSLTDGQRAALIELRSRFALTSPDCPLPQSEATEAFYVKFRAPLRAELARQLTDAGASFVGYAYPNAHFVRARDAETLAAVGGILRSSNNVVGTLLRDEMDACSPEVWSSLSGGNIAKADYRMMFWGDVTGAAAQAWLAANEIPILEAAYTEAGVLDLDSLRFVEVNLTPDALRRAIRSPLVEWVEFKPIKMAFNANSTLLLNAAPSDVGPATSYNLTGAGMVVGVWDGGTARPTHAAFQSAGAPNPFSQYFPTVAGRVVTSPMIRPTSSGGLLPAGQAWGFSDASGISDHPCHVTGTVVSDGTTNAQGRGFAPEAFAVSLGWGSMELERQSIRHYLRHVADNHSYGNAGGGTGGYDGSAQASDIDTRDILLNMFKAAGNSGSGNNTLPDDSCMKNSLTIGATSDTGTIASFSSRGPADDGRVLPHFSANGVDLTSTTPGSDTSFQGAGWSGTSMATPSACGGTTLLAELWKREFNNQFFSPDVVRALYAATASDRGNQGPDYRYGWGLIDVQRAADLILAHKNNQRRHIVRGQIRQNQVVEYQMTVTSGAPLRVALSWLDIHASTGAGTKLVNDLDLELLPPGSSTPIFPWSGLLSSGAQTTQFVQTGPNRRDNLEVVDVLSPAVGTWTVRVRGFNMPAMPQATVLNDATGFVLACERPILHGKEFVEDPLNGGSPVNIPDNNATGVSRTFTFTGAGTVSAIRVFADVRHPRRGDINIFLVAPDNTTITLEGSDTSTRRDIIGVFPDTRQYNDDVVAMIGKTVAGTWTVRVNDISAGPTSTQNNILPGQILYLAVEIDANTGTSTNQSPVANAGPNQSVTEGSPVVLDGTSSFDPDADPISYTWSQAGGPPVTLVGANTATPAFTAPLVGSNQVCSFQLTVDDGNGGIGTDFVSVTVLDVVAPNNAPTADAGVDFSVESGDTANLDATASADPDGDPLSFSWTQLSGPGVTLTASGTATPSFTAPSVVASTMITMQVTVDDGRGGQHADTVTVTVEPPNNPPVADAGTDVNAVRNAVVTLFGGGSSDPDGDPLTYLWTQVAGTNQVTLNNSTTATPDFIAPATDDVLILQLLVDDGRGAQSVDTVTVTVTSNGGSTSGKKSSKNSEEGCSTGDQGSYLWLAVLALCGGWLLWRRRQSNSNLKLQRQSK